MSEREFLRKEYTAKREPLSQEKVKEYSRMIVDRITELTEFKNASTILVYSHIKNEVSLDSLLIHPESKGKRFAFPVCMPERKLKALVPGDWKTGAFGIPEPDINSSQVVMPEKLDMVICPGTAFDSACHRLSMGGGYYDGFLPQCTNDVKLMAAYEIQHTNDMPFEEWDYPMDMIVTETNIYRNTVIRRKDND